MTEYPYPPSGPRRRPGWVWAILGCALAILGGVVVLFVLWYDGYFGASPHPYFGLFGGFFVFFLVLMILFFVVRVAFWSRRAYGYRSGYGGGPYGGPGRLRDPAVMAARERYARGEISREQFDQIMTDLGRRGRGPGGPLSGA